MMGALPGEGERPVRDAPASADDMLALVQGAFRRCSPSACWSVKHDLEQHGVTVEYAALGVMGRLDYPIGFLARLAGELAVIFGEQAPERLRELGTSDDVIRALGGEA